MHADVFAANVSCTRRTARTSPMVKSPGPVIIEAAASIAGRLIEREHPRLVVVACNTMSVVALSELRARSPSRLSGWSRPSSPRHLFSAQKARGRAGHEADGRR